MKEKMTFKLGIRAVCGSVLCIMLALGGCARAPLSAQTKPWQSLDRDALDLAYNNSKAVPESGAMFARWLVRSEQMRARHPEHLNLTYGPRPRNRIDYFSAGANTPVLIFIHGGFWQMRSKDDFAFAAESFLASGVSVAMVGYPLAPDASMDEIVADTHAAIQYLAKQIPVLGGDPRRVVVSGWSSGGHLATMMMDEPLLRGGVAISGLYELEPLLGSYINDQLKMNLATAKRNSPILLLPSKSTPLELFAGSAELPEMRRQTLDYANARRVASLPSQYSEIPEADHYTILNSMMNSDGRIHLAIMKMLTQ